MARTVAVVWDGAKAYFFQGGQYTRYDIAADKADEGYPQSISSGWAGVFADGVDAAVVWPNGKAYFFRGDQYTRYDVAADAADEGYPQPIASGWPGLVPGGAPGPAPTPGPVPAPVATGTGTHASVRDGFISFSNPFEGRVRWMYADIKGLVTTGIGNLIEPVGEAQKLPFVHKTDGSPATQDEIAADWQAVKGDPTLAQRGFKACEAVTNLRLTDAAIDQLVLAKFDANDRTLSRFFSGWSSWPADAQLGAHSIAWAGAGFPTKWPKFKAAAEARDWRAVAAESHLQDSDNPGVRPRNEADVKLFNNAAVVEETGRDTATLVYPQQL